VRVPTLPRPPAPAEKDFTGRVHDARVGARLGLWLGVTFGLCFVTGLLSHLVQHPTGWFAWPTRPVSLYRITQGVHVLSGIAAVPLLLAKLYAVYPRLFTRPAVRSVPHALERGSVFVLVGAAFFELVTGLLNIAQWYAFGFSFPRTHYAVAWVAAGAVLVHVAVKLPVIRRALGSPVEGAPGEPPVPDGGLSRRAFLRGTGVASGAALLATAGMTVPGMRRVSVLAVRSLDGPQGLPVNRSARAAGVVAQATDPAFRLTLVGPGGRRTLSRDDLLALPRASARLPIACVEGWSATGTWSGVRVSDLVALVGAPSDADVRFTSLQVHSAYRQTVLPAAHVRDRLSLLALRLNGEDLHPDHGFPCRVITASRPGVLQTKWVTRVEVLA